MFYEREKSLRGRRPPALSPLYQKVTLALLISLAVCIFIFLNACTVVFTSSSKISSENRVTFPILL